MHAVIFNDFREVALRRTLKKLSELAQKKTPQATPIICTLLTPRVKPSVSIGRMIYTVETAAPLTESD